MPELVAVGDVRHFVRSVLADAHLEPDGVVLVASELASNAVVHARSQFSVALECDGMIRVEVTDESSRLPVSSTVAEDALSGRGLQVVDAVAVRWGVQQHPGQGKTIWAEIHSTQTI
jgi:anti-sigma regulatory factor (Ser/Thr protein kinase)